jgi:hypothetical protein
VSIPLENQEGRIEAVNQCLWRKGPCETTDIFCDDCRSLLDRTSPFKEIGNCFRPVSWTASVDAGSRNWLALSATSGSDNGNGSTIVVNVNAQGKLLGRYTGQITLEATDSNRGPVRDSPQYIAVTLNVIA